MSITFPLFTPRNMLIILKYFKQPIVVIIFFCFCVMDMPFTEEKRKEAIFLVFLKILTTMRESPVVTSPKYGARCWDSQSCKKP